MKKLIAMMMALAIVASFAACGTAKNETENKTDPTNQETVEDTTGEAVEEDITAGDTAEDELVIGDTTAAVEILEYAWVGMGAEHQPASIGGHFSAEYTGGPYTYELAYAEDLAAALLLPEDQMDKVTDAATVQHMLNTNSLMAGVIKLSEGTDVQVFADAVADRISNNQWMCGFPEKMAVIQVNDDFLFVAYGLIELVDPMVNGMGENWIVNELYNQLLIEEETGEIVE